MSPLDYVCLYTNNKMMSLALYLNTVGGRFLFVVGDIVGFFIKEFVLHVFAFQLLSAKVFR